MNKLIYKIYTYFNFPITSQMFIDMYYSDMNLTEQEIESITYLELDYSIGVDNIFFSDAFEPVRKKREKKLHNLRREVLQRLYETTSNPVLALRIKLHIEDKYSLQDKRNDKLNQILK